MVNNRKCIAVLTKGYQDISDYHKLILRNECIEKKMNDLEKEEIDILIFHEGNITDLDQEFIKNMTPSLKIIFINVKNGFAFKEEKRCIPFTFNMGCFGYRSMCSFWFVDFWHFIKDYDYLLRIDEDCFIEFEIQYAFECLKTNLFITGRWSNDEDYVTVGLNELTLRFMNRELNMNKLEKKVPCSGPYTNVFGIDLSIRENPILTKYIEEVEKSNRIYSHRWGDLPLWGEAIDYIFKRNSISILESLKYYHESHKSQVN